MLVVPSGCGGGGGGGAAASQAPTPANLEIAFVSQPPGGSPGFRHVYLNISAVKINPDPNAALGDSRWVTIPVAEASGNGRGASPGDLQIDLNTLQTQAVLFNTGGVPVNTYQQVQVVIDVDNPGTIVPVCQGVSSNREGCINYPVAFTNSSQSVTFVVPPPGLTVSKGGLAQLLINLGLQIDAAPPASGGSYFVTPTVAQGDANSFLGLVTGNVVKSGTAQGTGRVIPLTVSAEPAGTSDVVASAQVLSDGTYTLSLPAAASGTSYDLFTSGGAYDFDVIRDVTVTPGAVTNPPDLNVTARSSASLEGVIQDGCNSEAVEGATLELLAPPKSAPVDCSANPQDCVVVATASTDNTGAYPLAGTRTTVPLFSQLPAQVESGATLGLQMSATGYNTVLTSVQQSGGAYSCPSSSDSKKCSLGLQTAYIRGNVAVTAAPPSGSSVQVQVFAEDTGTNNLVAALPMPAVIRATDNTSFTLNVPVGGDFDLFAAAVDPFQGAPAPYPGHTIEVAQGVQGPTSACGTVTLGSGALPTIPALDCVGHGSVSGSVNNPDLETTVEASKDGVQLFGTTPGLLASGINTNYSLCLPPGSYLFQRFENGAPATPTSQATVTVPQPAATSTPCPSSCGSSSSCPGECTNMTINPL